MGGQDITDSVAEKLGVPLAEAEGIKQTLGLVGAGGEYERASRAVESVTQVFLDEVRGSLDYYAASNLVLPDRPRGRLRRWLLPARPGRAARHDHPLRGRGR